MFLFQNPVLPVWKLRANDNQMQVDWFTGKELGAKPGTFTLEDIELYKYTFAEYGTCEMQFFFSTNRLLRNPLFLPPANSVHYRKVERQQFL